MLLFRNVILFMVVESINQNICNSFSPFRRFSSLRMVTGVSEDFNKVKSLPVDRRHQIDELLLD